jgi:hypothetical protein
MVWIPGSGSKPGSLPKCHRSTTLPAVAHRRKKGRKEDRAHSYTHPDSWYERRGGVFCSFAFLFRSSVSYIFPIFSVEFPEKIDVQKVP